MLVVCIVIMPRLVALTASGQADCRQNRRRQNRSSQNSFDYTFHLASIKRRIQTQTKRQSKLQFPLKNNDRFRSSFSLSAPSLFCRGPSTLFFIDNLRHPNHHKKPSSRSPTIANQRPNPTFNQFFYQRKIMSDPIGVFARFSRRRQRQRQTAKTFKGTGTLTLKQVSHLSDGTGGITDGALATPTKSSESPCILARWEWLLGRALPMMNSPACRSAKCKCPTSPIR